MVKSRQKFPNSGGVQKNQKCPKFKNFPSKGGAGGLRTWEQFPSYMASLSQPTLNRPTWLSLFHLREQLTLIISQGSISITLIENMSLV